jgi:excisionase family DNA binding protein
MMDKWMTSDDVLEYIGVSPATLYRLMKNGKITYYKTSDYKSAKVKFKREDVEKYLESIRVN